MQIWFSNFYFYLVKQHFFSWSKRCIPGIEWEFQVWTTLLNSNSTTRKTRNGRNAKFMDINIHVNFHAISISMPFPWHLTHALPLIKTSLLEDSSKQRFSSLMSLQIWKSGQCFEVSSINYSTNILTFSDWVCLWSDIVWLLLLLLLLYFKLTK